MSSRRLVLLPRAELDVSAILQYSIEEWGPERRNALAARIASTFETLVMESRTNDRVVFGSPYRVQFRRSHG